MEKEIYVEIQATPRRQINLQNAPTSGTVSPAKCLLFSAVFPGAGNVKATGKPYYYAIGLVGYSLVTASVMINWKAADRYDQYKESLLADERNTLFNKAKELNDRSKLFAEAAAGLWVADLVFTWFQAKAKNKNSGSAQMKWRLSPGLTFGNSPSLTFQYHF